MEILLTLLTGLAIGVVAKFIMPGDDPGGFIVTILIGIAGAFVGGFERAYQQAQAAAQYAAQ